MTHLARKISRPKELGTRFVIATKFSGVIIELTLRLPEKLAEYAPLPTLERIEEE